jgi:hypothetical protein
VPGAIFRLFGIVPHQLIRELVRRLGLAQPILETVPQRIQRMPLAFAQAVILEELADRGRERVTIVAVARETVRELPDSLERDANQRNVAPGKLGLEPRSSGRTRICGMLDSRMMWSRRKLMISDGRAPVLIITSSAARSSAFMASSAPGASSRLTIHQAENGGRGRELAPSSRRPANTRSSFNRCRRETRRQHAGDMRQVAVGGIGLDLAVDDAIGPMVDIGQRVIARQPVDRLVADDIDQQRDRAHLAVFPFLELAGRKFRDRRFLGDLEFGHQAGQFDLRQRHDADRGGHRIRIMAPLADLERRRISAKASLATSSTGL